MLGNDFIAIFAFFALCIRLYGFLCSLLAGDIIVVHCNRFVSDFFSFVQNESLHIDKPPRSCFVFDEITNKLFEFDFQMFADKIYDVFDIFQSFFDILLTDVFDYSKSVIHFRIDNKFRYLRYFFLRCIRKVGIQCVRLMIAGNPPTCPYYRWFYAARFDESLDCADFVSAASHY
jgi:hypothetical protein